MTTEVISLKGWIREYGPRLEHAPKNLVYIGRRWTLGGWDLPAHPLANPFSVKSYGSPEAAVSAYIRHLGRHPQLVEQAKALQGSVLACWCSPLLCHAHIVRALADGMPLHQVTARADAFDLSRADR